MKAGVARVYRYASTKTKLSLEPRADLLRRCRRSERDPFQNFAVTRSVEGRNEITKNRMHSWNAVGHRFFDLSPDLDRTER
jgi:hypothetical protein